MIAGLVAIVLANTGSQASGGLISFHSPASDVQEVVKQIATRASQNLMVADSVGPLQVVISADRIGSQVLLDNLATATHTEWNREGDAQALGRPALLRNALGASDLKVRTDAIRASIGQVPESSLLTDTPYNIASRAWKSMDEYIHRRANTQEIRNDVATFRVTSLARELLLGFVKTVDPGWFADLPFNTPVVFSDQPTAAQRKLPDSVGKLTARYAAAETALSEIASQNIDPELAKDFFVRNVLATLGPDQRIDRVIVTCRWVRNEVRCSLATFTKSGGLKAIDSMTIPLRLESNGRFEGVNLSGVEVDLSSESRNYEQLIGKPNRALALELFDSPDDIAKLDPLQFTVSELLKELSNRLGKPVVACLSDEIGAHTSGLVKDGVVSLSSFVTALMRNHEVIVGKDAVVIRPSFFLDADRIRLPRSAIRNAVRRSVPGQPFDVRGQVVFSFEAGNGTTSPLYGQVLDLLAHAGGEPRQALYTSTWVQRILGSLSELEWKQLVERKSLEISAKRPGTASLVFAWTSDPILACAFTEEAGGVKRDVLLNGSESWPSVSASRTLRVTLGQESMVKSLQGEGSYYSTYPTSFVPVSEFWKTFEGAKSEGEAVLSQFRNRNYSVGSRRTFLVEFWPVEGVIKSEELPEFQIKSQANPVKFSEIPGLRN